MNSVAPRPTEVGRPTIHHVFGSNIVCAPNKPRVTLVTPTGSAGPFEARGCSPTQFDVVVTPTQAGEQTVEIENGDAARTKLVSCEDPPQLFADPSCSSPQIAIGPGIRPSIAVHSSSSFSSKGLVAAIDPTSSKILLYPLTATLLKSGGTPVTTTQSATQVAVAGGFGSNIGVVYATATEVGLFWVDPNGSPVATPAAPPPIATAGATDLSAVSSFNGIGILWRDGAGAIQFASVESGTPGWKYAATTPIATAGTSPSLALGQTLDFFALWGNATDQMTLHNIELDGTNFVQFVDIYSRKLGAVANGGPRAFLVGPTLFVTGFPSDTMVIGAGTQTVPATLLASNTSSVHALAYRDTEGGVSYATGTISYFDGSNSYRFGARRIFGQAADPDTRPSLALFNGVTWAAQLNNSVMMGRLCP